MKTVYFVTEGKTDQIVLQALVAAWLGTDFRPRFIQPPASAFMEELAENLSEGWKGVVAWCSGARPTGSAGRNEAINNADCLVVHVDADVASRTEFLDPPFLKACPPAANAANWVRNRLCSLFDGGNLPPHTVLCVPTQSLEAWTLCALHPDIADQYAPIECRREPEALLVSLPPHRLIRRKNGSYKKDTTKYATIAPRIATVWQAEVVPRCLEAARFETETKQVLSIP